MISKVEVRTAEAILDATLLIVGERGLEAVTHRAVAERAGVSLGAISHYHESREDLLRAALAHAAAAAVARLERLALDLQTRVLDTDEWIEAMAGAIAEDLRHDRVGQLTQVELLLGAARDPALREVSRPWGRAHLRVAEAGLRAAGSSSPQTHARLLVAAATGLMLKQLAFPDPSFDRADLAARLGELVRRLVTPDGEQK
jgi:DNA-binding transcriptional regulator YbjK